MYLDASPGGDAHLGMLGLQFDTMVAWQAAVAADPKVFDMAGNAGGGESHSIEGDPLFINEAGGNFHLSLGSPAIAAGIAIPDLTEDFDGKPVADPPCIGAFEYP